MVQEDHKHRRSVRMSGYDYSSCGAYFVTICAQERMDIFGKIADGIMELNENGVVVKQTLDELPGSYPGVSFDQFVVMPNHLHFIVCINNVGAIHESPIAVNQSSGSCRAIHELPLQRRRMLLPKIIGRLKMQTAKQINIMRQTPGIPVWQRNYYEHVIRNEEEMYQIQEYIINNPQKWDLDNENTLNIRKNLQHDLDHLAGVWGKKEADEIGKAVEEQRTVDEKLWK